MAIPPVKVIFPEEDRKEILRRIDECLASGQVAQGRNTKEFEQEFAAYVGTRHAVALASGGAALEVGMRLLGVKDREVLVPTNTFAATATSVMLAGGRVRLLDTDSRTFSVSLEAVKAAVTPATAGVVVVHIGGIVTPEIESIRRFCDERGLWLFEDAAHAHGSTQAGRMAGRFGSVAAYSFYATKVMTSGEGGMLVTDDDALADRARGLRDYGKPDPWVSFHTEVGANWRICEFSSAVGLIHFRRLEEFVGWRERVAQQYTEGLRGLPLQPVLPTGGRSSWYKYIALLPRGVDRDKLKAAMKAAGVSLAGGVYDVPLHRQPVFKDIATPMPVADDVCPRHVCLPIYYGMREEEVSEVLATLAATLKDQGVRA
jgi:dTDP-4-amino-4,6-dideoxygalactose transaminase